MDSEDFKKVSLSFFSRFKLLTEARKEHSDAFLTQQWLVKLDTSSSVPYLFVSEPLMTCCMEVSESRFSDFQKVLFTEDVPCSIMVSDTKSVWAESKPIFTREYSSQICDIHNHLPLDSHVVLNPNHAARRWRSCNPNVPMTNDEQSREQLRTLLSAAHNAGSISDASFEVVESPDAVSSEVTY